jgi:hypothetical protein
MVSKLRLTLLAATLLLGTAPARAADDVLWPLPATGQTRSHRAELVDGTSASVPDDGALRTGAPMQFRDNGDGTITDLVTMLVWEKKCARCGGLHDVERRYPWSGDGEEQTAWDWIEAVNREDGTGFAGHADWRLPTVTELLSIVDYGRMVPPVTEEFDGDACDDACTDLTSPACSCTAVAEYWTSTTFADFPAHAYAIFFNIGFVTDSTKSLSRHVRAVRGGR